MEFLATTEDIHANNLQEKKHLEQCQMLYVNLMSVSQCTQRIVLARMLIVHVDHSAAWAIFRHRRPDSRHEPV